MDRSTTHYQHERVAVEALVPYARNSRTHSAEQISQLVRSIREFGFTAPVLIDVAVKRWQAFTGKRATHAVTGAPFPA
jgi:hypothetical protein